jgi:single-strand DNA-binding protein
MNKFLGYGNVGKDPEVKHLESGKVVAKFSFATNESYTNQSGEKVTETQWHNISAWGKTAETIEKYVKKGSSIIVEGKVTYPQYEDKEGVTKYITEIMCDRFHFAGGKKDEQKQDEGIKPSDAKKTTVKSMSNIEDLPGYVDSEVPGDDEPPFA